MQNLQEGSLQQGEVHKLKKTFKEGEIYKFIIATFKGISQVMLIENAITGLIIFIAITIASYVLGLVMLFSVVLGTLIAKIGGADDTAVNQGLFGFNSALTGIALTLFLSGPYNWIIALIGGALVSVVTAALMHFIKGTNIPILTFPFIILTWFMLLISYKLDLFQINPTLVPIELSGWALDITGNLDLFSSFSMGIAQVFFIDNVISGILILAALFWAGWRYGLYAIIASVTGLLTALLLGGEVELISVGLFGYNAVLTIIAVSIVFKDDRNLFALLSGIIGSAITVLITASLSVWLMPFGLPALTMAFVLTSWVILGARKMMPRF